LTDTDEPPPDVVGTVTADAADGEVTSYAVGQCVAVPEQVAIRPTSPIATPALGSSRSCCDDGELSTPLEMAEPTSPRLTSGCRDGVSVPTGVGWAVGVCSGVG
jgi:hypothetical protein